MDDLKRAVSCQQIIHRLLSQHLSSQKDVSRDEIGPGKRRLHDDGNSWNFLCPHCDQYAEVPKQQVNCRIFRHAVYKHNLRWINPHSSKELCDKLIDTEQVYGCAKPIRFRFTSTVNYVEICGYI